MRDEGEKDGRSGHVGRIKQLEIRRKLVEELDDAESQHGIVLNNLSSTTQTFQDKVYEVMGNDMRLTYESEAVILSLGCRRSSLCYRLV